MPAEQRARDWKYAEFFSSSESKNVSNTKYYIDYLQAALQREDDDPLISEYLEIADSGVSIEGS